MWFHRNKEREEQFRQQEAEIQAIHHDTLKKIDNYAKKIEKGTKEVKKLNDIMETQEGITELIFLATGGDRRSRK